MKPCCHQTNIRQIRVNQMSGGSSINYGDSIHKGLQANQKINTSEYVIGDEFSFASPEEEEE
ncbi:hypothetical protein J2Z83_002184 [Virgibacillus natechei]|uniref:Uncharacterized protein n=1 Tax=Virgibacillus natechei TaxID=1216297 RepID=A0ABS4IGK4_9BACI|nr:hypothetical protein [Virgibacillus natechei]MBP1970068.1 hypothetical protein [Virgibacillus natechei]UZD14149.1 hypothetical protein OLD84_06425 [Virgibacillus natechei]